MSLSAEMKLIIKGKSNVELYEILSDHERLNIYSDAEIIIVCEELRRRNLNIPIPNQFDIEVEVNRDNAEEEKKVSSATVLHPSVRKEEAYANVISSIENIVKFCFIVLVLIGLPFGIFEIYSWMDKSRQIAHQEETVITARSDWLVGESKDCWSATLNSDVSAHLGKESGYAMSSISCDDGPEHEMKVTFYGQKVQIEYKVVNWRCSRNEISFTCNQTGGVR
jgi:hypothetical protein